MGRLDRKLGPCYDIFGLYKSPKKITSSELYFRIVRLAKCGRDGLKKKNL